MNEPITISEEARKAFLSELGHPDAAMGLYTQLAINSATSPLQKRIEELEKSSAEYIAQTDPLLSCVNPSDEVPHCGVCRVCLLAKVEELEKRLLAMREALNWFEIWFKENSGGGKLGCPWCYASSYNDDNGWREFKHSADCLIGKALNSTPEDLARKYVKREVLEKVWHYAAHMPSCHSLGNPAYCDCGFAEVATLARKELEK